MGKALDCLFQKIKDLAMKALGDSGLGLSRSMVVEGSEPLRTVVALYSLALNGYQPSGVILFGEYQWSDLTREVFSKLLPFSTIVPTHDVLTQLEKLGGTDLAELARQHPLAMKACINVLSPPHEFCFVDDDVFVLRSLDSALSAFRGSDLVSAPDRDYEKEYLAIWGAGATPQLSSPLPTRRINTGFFCLRNSLDPGPAGPASPRKESLGTGLRGLQFSRSKVEELSSQQYFYPYLDGLPGGILGAITRKTPAASSSFTSAAWRKTPRTSPP